MDDWITVSSYSEIVFLTPDELPDGITHASSAPFLSMLVGQWRSSEVDGTNSIEGGGSVRYEFFPDGHFLSVMEMTDGEKHRTAGYVFADAKTLWFTVLGQTGAAKLPYSLTDDILTIRGYEPDSCLALKRVTASHL